eukprot:Blabericola_migrator_1__5793@NODE_2934_length_2191_cov_137_740113_g1840_i0_p5_GENE_NODE_2934_length_2191_cov_137_740113_g1840_i0NODE_2934_length_2191_cov_137_740113_g1840_i0_p5_ORF_typecomplete_len189_score23_17C2/PF00168_30/1e12NTC2/PF10358_9/0_0017C2C2_1/PF11618_8/0_024RPGR1_C/PF18111_1/0_042_NODE_2934_length_2191_cov_137_740113_g1840_i014712037
MFWCQSRQPFRRCSTCKRHLWCKDNLVCTQETPSLICKLTDWLYTIAVKIPLQLFDCCYKMHRGPHGHRSVQVTLISGHDFPTMTGLFDKTDPFVEVVCGGHSERTAVVKNAGSKCTWNTTFTLPYDSDPKLLFRLYDDEEDKPAQLLGTGSLNLLQHLQDDKYDGEIHCVDEKGKAKGTLTVQVTLQ